MKDRIAAGSRDFKLWKSQSDNDVTSQMVRLKMETDDKRRDIEDLYSRVRSMDELSLQLDAKVNDKRKEVAELENEVNQINSRIRTVKHKNDITGHDLDNVVDRCDSLSHEVTASPQKHKLQESQARSTLTNLEKQIEKVRRATFKSHVRAEALQKYINLMMTINEDLCTTLTAREMTKDKILEFAKKYAPPRYTWPKDLEYKDVVDLITNAALSVAKDGAVASASAATIAAVRSSPLRFDPEASSGTGLGESRRSRGDSNLLSGLVERICIV